MPLEYNKLNEYSSAIPTSVFKTYFKANHYETDDYFENVDIFNRNSNKNFPSFSSLNTKSNIQIKGYNLILF